MPLILPLTLDGRLLGDIAVDAKPAGPGSLVDGPRLVELLGKRLGAGSAARLTAVVAGRPKVPLDEIVVDGVTLSLDMAALTLRAEAAGAALAERRFSIGSRIAPDPGDYDRQAGIAAGAGLSLFQRIAPDQDGRRYAPQPVDFILEGYASVGGFEGLALTYAAQSNGGIDDVQFRDVALYHDRYGPAVRFGLGELSPRLSGFQGSGDVLGIGVERRFSDIRPFQNIRASGRREIVLERPSDVEFFVNGVSLGVRRLAAGPYSLDDFPLEEGGNTIQLVVRDPAGRQEVLDFGVFQAPSLLGPGIVDFGFWGGYQTRGDLKREGRPLATGFVEWGATSGLTLGAGAQAGRGIAQIGGRAIIGVGRTILEADVAHSRNRDLGLSGQAIAFDLRQTAGFVRPDDFILSAQFEARGKGFGTLSQPLPGTREKWRAAAAVAWQLPRDIGLNLGGNYSRGRAGAADGLGFTGSVFGRWRQLTLTATANYQQTGRDRETRLILGAALPFGDRFNGTVRGDILSRDREFQISRFLGTRLREVGGAFQASQSETRRQVEGRLEFAGQRVGAEIGHQYVDPLAPGEPAAHSSRWRLSTFLGMADGLFGVGREARGGFAVVRRHPTLHQAALTLTDGSRVVGRSDGLGNLLLPIERAYADVRAAVAAEPLPLGYDIGAGVLRLFPGLAGGYAITIGSDASLTVLGVFTNRAGEPLKLIAGELTNPKLSAPIPFFTNSAGRFAANKVAPGRYDIEVRGQMVGSMEVKAGEDSLVQMGRIALALD